MSARTATLLGCVVLLFTPAGASAQLADDKVFRQLTTDQTEAMLKNLKVDFKKSLAEKGDKGTAYFDFARGNYKIRLTSFDGKDLMLDCLFKGVPLDKVNDWNTSTKFSRASLQRDKMGEFAVLEYNLDVIGGVTEGTIKQYLTRFDEELKAFDRFITTVVVVGDDKVAPAATSAVIEKIFSALGLKFEKKEDAKGMATYDFEMNNFKLRFYNFGGRDVMVDAIFRKLPPDVVNKYNLDRKFVRCVAYNRDGKEYTALEANFDCSVGVSEEMLRHFLVAFGDDVVHFARIVQKQ